MSAHGDRCRFCGADVTTVVRTANGASRVCDAHVAVVPSPINIARLPEFVSRFSTRRAIP